MKRTGPNTMQRCSRSFVRRESVAMPESGFSGPVSQARARTSLCLTLGNGISDYSFIKESNPLGFIDVDQIKRVP